MSDDFAPIGPRERLIQERVIRLLTEQLGWRYLANWHDRENRNVEGELLKAHLRRRGASDAHIVSVIHALETAANNQAQSLYQANKAFYQLLRWGVNFKPSPGEPSVTVLPINWEEPEVNDFAIAEEVTVLGRFNKRPDIVLYINGIAIGVLELKRSTISLSEGIRQNITNQRPEFIQHFFNTVQIILAGNDAQGLHYGAIGTPEKWYLRWKEEGTPAPPDALLDHPLLHLLQKKRLLELIHDFTAFDGTRVIARPNQYFGVKAAQEYVKRCEGGIIWHTQGSGKSMTMVWLAHWIRENIDNSRVLMITDREELDDQIEGVFTGVGESIVRATSGIDLVTKLNEASPPLLCSLIHKMPTNNSTTEEAARSRQVHEYLSQLRGGGGFAPKGEIFVFVDECHRTQSGELHEGMKALLPNATFVGFTGTPLLKKDKRKSIEVFGPYIHTYHYGEAVQDGVVLDLRYEARFIDQEVKSPERVDQWFEMKTAGLNDVAKRRLKQRWVTMQEVLSSRDRLQEIVGDIMLDFERQDRLKSRRGNAILVSDSIYSACRYYEIFQRAGFRECAIITSYRPNAASIANTDTGEAESDDIRQFKIYRQMVASWFNTSEEQALARIDRFEDEVKQKFIKEPGAMRLLIVVDKLLTGFDAPPATFLYIDKPMRDHGLFQAICRVNRLDTEDKEYGYIVDYSDLFNSLRDAVKDYTSGAFDGFDKADVADLLKDRLDTGRQHFEDMLEAITQLCEPVSPPKAEGDYIRYFCAENTEDADALAENEGRRLDLYKATSALMRAWANIANEAAEAGYTPEQIAQRKRLVERYTRVRSVVGLASGDLADLKRFEQDMRHLLDNYISAEASEVIAQFNDMPLLNLFIQEGAAAVAAGIGGETAANADAVAEVIVNNIRSHITQERPQNPAYYDHISALLMQLIEQRRLGILSHARAMEEFHRLAQQATNPSASNYPAGINTAGKRALYDNLGQDEALALRVDRAILDSRPADWRGHRQKEKRIKLALAQVLDADAVDAVFDIIKEQREY